MSNLIIPCDLGLVSDGYHTFNELYEHRCSLFLALMKSNPTISWFSDRHADGSTWVGWFIAGMRLPTGIVTYHLPSSMWTLTFQTGAEMLDRAPEWDGHTSTDVVNRLQEWVKTRS